MIQRPIAITFDVDWAPDFAITRIVDKLVARSVRSTWFVTHATPQLDRMRSRPDLFELGIHPNFLPGSSHGKNTHEVLAHCMALVPEAVSMRTHGLVQSTAILRAVLESTPIRHDSSIILPRSRPTGSGVFVHPNGRVLHRHPCTWMDDFETLFASPCFRPSPSKLSEAEYTVFALHPTHVVLNTNDLGTYQRFMSSRDGARRLDELTEADFAPFASTGEGAATMLDALIDLCAASGGGTFLRDLPVLDVETRAARGP